MADTLDLEILRLSTEFPPIPTPEWEAVIQKDLKGADYEKRLVWRTDEGFPVRPYYRSEALKSLGELADLAPGQFPYTRGDGAEPEEATSISKDAIRADFLHDAGGTAVEELGFALAQGVERLSAAIEAKQSVDSAASGISFAFAVGSNYFFEIAKLRAARELWSAAVAAFGPAAPKSAKVRIHARTARINKSALDPYTNLLRVTTEAAAAMVGGCDALSVEPFGFGAHLAANVQRILREEGYLTRVADPAGGSYYVEALTDAFAQSAWKLFQQVEAAGGWSAALNSGMVKQALAASRQAKADAISTRRRALVGVNNYPNTNEKAGDPPTFAPLENDPFPQTRLAEPFEVIRRRTIAHAERTGRSAKILLLKRGDLKMKTARSNFCMNFFACGGFEVVEGEDYAGTDADLMVLCSADPEYLPFAQEVCARVKVPVLVAGNPKEQISQLQAAGVQGFVHMGSNLAETLNLWQDKLGMASLTGAKS